MKPVLTASEYARIDAEWDGDVVEAMERAGLAVALAAARHGAEYGKKVVVLAGPGNNGGDGYVAARYLKRRGVDVVVHRLGKPKTEAAIQAANRARAEGVQVGSLGSPIDCDLIIDALFGGSARTGLSEEVLAWMDSPAPVVAVDYPTGIDPDTGGVADRAFKAVETVTFGALKTGQVSGAGPDHCGVVTVVDIGIDGGVPALYVAEESDAPRPSRGRKVHKWSAGSVLVAGGSDGMVGAVVLAARSALNFGASAVYMTSPQPDEAHLMAPQIPTLSLEDAGEMLSRFDVLVIGPGLAPDDVEMVIPLVAEAERVVLDAGGLVDELLQAAIDAGAEVVVTPHNAEFKRIAGVGGGQFALRSFAIKKGVCCLLKGNPTRISDGGLPILVTTGGPELASIGTGDVLAGMIGALWARGLERTEAVVSGAYWHGVAATDLARSRSVTADLLADHIGGYAW